MRPELLDPTIDVDRLNSTVELIEELCRLHKEEEDCSSQLVQLSELVGHPIRSFDAAAASHSQAHETLARKLLFHPSNIPSDLSKAEMLEMIERVRTADGTEFQLYFWLECLWVNTGDKRIDDLIHRPDDYFEDLDDDDSSRELSSLRILDTALARGKKGR